MQCQKLKTYIETGRVVFLPARTIRPNPDQPRRVFSPEALEELSQSIAQHGVLQPLGGTVQDRFFHDEYDQQLHHQEELLRRHHSPL